MRVFLRVSCVVCLLISAALTFFWMRGYYVEDVLHHFSADQRSLRSREYEVKSNSGNIIYVENTITYEEADGFDLGVAITVQRGTPLGWSRTREKPFDNYAEARYRSPLWLARFAIAVDHGRYEMDVTQLRPVPQFFGSSVQEAWYITFPIWPLWLLFMLPPAIGCFLYIRRKRRSRVRFFTARCRKCNYDLRASKGRCPECGTPF